MTAGPSADDRVMLAGLSRSEQLEALKARMAAIPARVGTDEQPQPFESAAPSMVLPVPGGLGEALPHGGLPRGGVVACTGRISLLAGLIAAATNAGEWTAVIGYPQLGLLAIAEQGGDLSRLAVIPAPGADAVSVASILLDGVGVVVLHLPSTVTDSRVRALAARVRSRDAVLIVTGSDIRADLDIRSELARYDGVGRGRGRLRSIAYDITASGRTARRPRRTRVQLSGAGERVCWVRQDPLRQVDAASFGRTG